MTGFRHGRRVSALALVLVGALLLGACGKPAYTYVTNKNANTYFKVPTEWPAVEDTNAWDYNFAQVVFHAPTKDSAAFETFKRVRWSVEYDSDTGPLIYSLVTPVPPDFQGDISLDWLRDMFAPVSLTARSKIIAAGQGIPAASFAEVVSHIRDGNSYANVHSSVAPGGEIRGQLR